MVTFLSGGTGTPKLLSGAESIFSPAETTVVANTGDDVELGGLLVCPDVDTVLFERAGLLDRDRWWGIEDDTHETHDELRRLSVRAGLEEGPRYLSEESQTEGRDVAAWRRFSAASEFMTIGDRDRALHLLRSSLIDEGHSLTEVIRTLARAYELELDLLPMSDEPVATIVHTERGPMHFQEFWVGRDGEPTIRDVEFRGTEDAVPAPQVLDALRENVIVGPSNPVTSIGPMLAIPGIAEALSETAVVAVSPFVEDRVFSGPAGELMAAVGLEPSTRGVADAYPFADAFVFDDADSTDLDRPIVRTDTRMDGPADAKRVARACREALELIR